MNSVVSGSVRNSKDILHFVKTFKAGSELFLGIGRNWQVSEIHLSAFLGDATHPRVPPVLLQVLFRLGQQVSPPRLNEGSADGQAVDGAEETLDARSMFRSLAIPFPGGTVNVQVFGDSFPRCELV